MDKLVKANFACGTNLFAHGWENFDKENMTTYIKFLMYAPVDEFTPDQKRLRADTIESGGIWFKMCNILELLPFLDESVDMIYCGSFIEHLNPMWKAKPFLMACLKILKPNGLIRITCPDLEELVRAYNEDRLEEFNSEQPEEYANSKSRGRKLAYILFGSCGMNSNATNYEGHMMAYDFEGLKELLEESGFRDIQRMEHDKSRSSVMEREMIEMTWKHLLIVEATK